MAASLHRHPLVSVPLSLLDRLDQVVFLHNSRLYHYSTFRKYVRLAFDVVVIPCINFFIIGCIQLYKLATYLLHDSWREGYRNGCQRSYGPSKLIDNGRNDSYIMTVWHTTFGPRISIIIGPASIWHTTCAETHITSRLKPFPAKQRPSYSRRVPCYSPGSLSYVFSFPSAKRL